MISKVFDKDNKHPFDKNFQDPFSPLQKEISKTIFPVYRDKLKEKDLESRLLKLQKEAADIMSVDLNGDMDIKNKLSDMRKKIDSIDKEIASIEEQLKKFQDRAKKREETHRLFKSIGGEQVKLVTRDRALIDGMFLDAGKFRRNLKDAGGQIITLTRKLANGEKQSLSGIAFDKKLYEKSPDHILDFLNQLNALSTLKKNNSKMGAGWTLIQDGDRIILTSDHYLQNCLNNPKDTGLVEYDHKTEEFRIRKEPQGAQTNRSLTPIDLKENPETGTVIITSGNAGVYEMHKQEALYFLLKGMNVFLFNFRGYGESEGLPTETGCNIDYETACEYVKKRTGCQNRQLLIKALCVSGGAAAHVAKLFPESNIFLDQSYNRFREVTKKNIKGICQDFFDQTKAPQKGTQMISGLIGSIGSFFTPNWQTAKDLSKNSGAKLFIFSTDDEVIPFSHTEELTHGLLSEGVSNKSLTLVPISGNHAVNWLDNWDRALEKTDDWYYDQKTIERLQYEKKTAEDQLIDLSFSTFTKFAESLDSGKPDNDIDHSLKEMDDLKKTIDNCENEIKKANITLESALTRYSYAARNQVDLFLKRLNLTDEIIPVVG